MRSHQHSLGFAGLLLTCAALSAQVPVAKEPIAYIGHGAMFDQDGKEVVPSAEFIARAQAWYREALIKKLAESDRAKFYQLESELAKGLTLDRQSRLVLEAHLLDWLISRADLKDRDRILGKNNLMKLELETQLPAKPEAGLIRSLEPFEVPKELLKRLKAEGMIRAPHAAAEPGRTVLFSITSAGGQAYRDLCAANGVPVPPDWGTSGWVSQGQLQMDDPTTPANEGETFISGTIQAEVFTYRSASPEGMCIALPRYNTANSIRLLGVICLGKVTAKACFWDNQNGGSQFFPQVGDVVPFSQFGGGNDLIGNVGGICTDCHRGENPYIIHPATALGALEAAGLPIFADDWYEPIVKAGWPQNAGPIVSPGPCASCHIAGGQGRRFPKLSNQAPVDGVPLDGYCGTILPLAIARTMPPGAAGSLAGTAQPNALLAMCASPPSPVMRIEQTTLDYGEVELGFSFAKAIIVHNDGDADLAITAAALTPIDSAVWTEASELAAPLTIRPGDPPAVLRWTFTPQQTTTADTITVRVAGNATPAQQDILLTGRGRNPTPIDSMLVLDRSGSMADQAGERRKIDALQVAANLYADLLRENIGSSGTGDQLGFVKYNSTNSVYMTRGFINAAKTAEVQDKLSNAAISDLARLRPNDQTGIGGAMQRAATELLGIPADRRQVMIVLTDGIENVEPFIGAVTGPIQTANPNLRMYSVGLGSSIEPDKLQSITNVTNGYHQVTDSLSGTSVFELETFYFKIFVNAAGFSLIVDPTFAINLTSPAAIEVDRARVVTSDKSATFLVLDDPLLRQFYDLAFISPKGDVMQPGSTIGGIPIHESHRHTYRVFRIIFPDLSQADSYVGDWVLSLKPNGKWSPEAVKRALAEQSPGSIHYSSFISPYQGLVPIGFAAAVASDYRMEVAVSAPNYLPGAVVTMTAALTDRGWPAPNGTVAVTVTSPGGPTRSVTLHDDGTHGDVEASDAIWTNRFGDTATPNVYKFLFRANGRNERGELAPREDSRYVTLKRPAPTPPDGKCLPCLKKCLGDQICKP